MITKDRERQINELFYNSLHNKELSQLDMTTLTAMQNELAVMIREKREQDFQEKAKQVTALLKEMHRNYPSASIWLSVEVDGVEEEVDILSDIEYWRFEP